MNEETPRNTTDPSLDPAHLTPDGKKKSKPVDRETQQARFEQNADDRSSEIIPGEITATPGPNLKDKKRPVMGIDND